MRIFSCRKVRRRRKARVNTTERRRDKTKSRVFPMIFMSFIRGPPIIYSFRFSAKKGEA
jgi:hypothetical protein